MDIKDMSDEEREAFIKGSFEVMHPAKCIELLCSINDSKRSFDNNSINREKAETMKKLIEEKKKKNPNSDDILGDSIVLAIANAFTASDEEMEELEKVSELIEYVEQDDVINEICDKIENLDYEENSILTVYCVSKLYKSLSDCKIKKIEGVKKILNEKLKEFSYKDLMIFAINQGYFIFRDDPIFIDIFKEKFKKASIEELEYYTQRTNDGGNIEDLDVIRIMSERYNELTDKNSPMFKPIDSKKRNVYTTASIRESINTKQNIIAYGLENDWPKEKLKKYESDLPKYINDYLEGIEKIESRDIVRYFIALYEEDNYEFKSEDGLFKTINEKEQQIIEQKFNELSSTGLATLAKFFINKRENGFFRSENGLEVIPDIGNFKQLLYENNILKTDENGHLTINDDVVDIEKIDKYLSYDEEKFYSYFPMPYPNEYFLKIDTFAETEESLDEKIESVYNDIENEYSNCLKELGQNYVLTHINDLSFCFYINRINQSGAFDTSNKRLNDYYCKMFSDRIKKFDSNLIGILVTDQGGVFDNIVEKWQFKDKFENEFVRESYSKK